MSTTIDPIKEKRDRQNKIRLYHQATFDRLKIINPKFIPKFAYTPLGKTEKYIAFFENEINHGADVYVEFADREFVLQSTTDRELYRLRYNPHYNTEYEKLPAVEEGKSDRYIIPIAELVLIQKDPIGPDVAFEVAESSPKLKTNTQAELEFPKLMDPNLDAPFEQMTLRDYAAIHLKKSCSTKAWLNDIIKSK